MIIATSTTICYSCKHCGLIHAYGGVCPRIKAIEYYPDGTIKRVEYHGPPGIGPLKYEKQGDGWVPL